MRSFKRFSQPENWQSAWRRSKLGNAGIFCSKDAGNICAEESGNIRNRHAGIICSGDAGNICIH